jgi:hypothetical protein
MPKDAFYFPHDSNARHDPKILKMRSTYKLEGLGLYWATVEMMREQENYLLPIDDGSIEGYSEDLHCDPKVLKKFINDCVTIFNLFQSDNEFVWSDSLIRRMAKFDEKSFQAKEAADKRWGNIPTHSGRNADDLQTHSERTNKKEGAGKGGDLNTTNTDAMPTHSGRNAIKSNKIILDNNKSNNNIPDFIDKELWYDFLEMRKKKRVPNTDRALKILLTRLIEFHTNKKDPNKSIEESIVHGWTGVFPAKDETKNGTENKGQQSPKPQNARIDK